MAPRKQKAAGQTSDKKEQKKRENAEKKEQKAKDAKDRAKKVNIQSGWL